MPMPLYTPLPAWPEGARWVNGVPSLEPGGAALLVHLWAKSCDCCKDGFPFLPAWLHAYGAAGNFRIVGIHAPRTPADADVDAVEAEIERLGFAHPVWIDAEGTSLRLFRCDALPAYYLFDADGRLRHAQIGDAGLGLLERTIRRLSTRQREGGRES